MPKAMSKDEAQALLPYASPAEAQCLNAIQKLGSQRKAAASLGIHPTTMVEHMAALRAKASLKGIAPDHGWRHSVPDTHYVKGVSTFYDAQTGEALRQWVKSDVDAQAREARYKAFLAGLRDEIPKAGKTPKPAHKAAESLCNLFVITDYHLGMKAWHEETLGSDWDMQIAEDLLTRWFEAAIAQSPAAQQAVFCQLADFLHFDSLEAVTPANRHQLDADTRYQKMVRVCLRVLRRCVSMLLAKHESVHIIMADGNHDPAGSAWLREAFAIFYEGEPRVTVDTSPATYRAYQWGQTALFFHHGHKRGVKSVSDVFAGLYREMFGATKYAYAHLGHLHHKDVKENNLMIVEQHTTLAANDAYSASSGFVSKRNASVITYSREYGEVGRVTISPEMVGS
jgi:hypothetical protein